ncbi:phage tail length tape measure family protein [Sphingomonas sp.]|jgi:hypothetical protein|uniref:phage tail length tape measure family protein n=1 Tax=Sphingomonas sp. TaxID=28214 RepID=UPI00262D094F|nr:phage tail length tape measure family protein [Sphingomonas sp.]MDF2495080.1 phage tail tape measure protein [Sphingomonas sp.]
MITAESLVVEIATRVDKARSDIKGVGNDFDTSANTVQNATRRIEAATTKATATIERDSARIANAQRNVARQYADIGAQLAGGQSPFLIAAQQAPQLADALADTGGKAAKVASFFAGPLGASLLAVGSILGATLVPALLSAGDASNTMSDAQADLKNYVDLTTGAINRQVTAVERLAAAQARQGAIEQQTNAYMTARSRAVGAVRDASSVSNPVLAASEVMDPRSAFDDPIKRRLRDLVSEYNAGRRSIGDFGIAVRQAVGDRPEYRELVKVVTAQSAAATDATRSVNKLRAEQALLTGTATAQQKALLGVGQATAGLIEKQVALATATTGLERARAKLALVEERGRTIQAGDAKALGQYRTDLTAAQNAVNAAEAAEKGATKAKRDHAAATREAAKAERERIKNLREAARAERDMIGLRSDLLSSKSDITSDSRLQDEYTRQRIRLDQQGQTSRLDEQRSLGELSQQEYSERKKLIDQITENRLLLVNRNETVRTSNEELAAAQARIGNNRELLEAQTSLARSARERAMIQNQLLDLAIEERRLAAQRIIDLATQGKASKEEGAIAQGTLDILPQVQAAGRRAISQQNMTPGQSYLSSLPGTAEEINDAIEGIEARGLDKLNDGLTDAIMGARSLGDAFSNVADQIISDLVRIAIQQAIIKPLAGLLFGADMATGGISGLVGSLVSGIFGGGRASGGPVSAGTTYLVGERGPELLRMGAQSGTVVPNHAITNLSGIAGSALRPPAQQPVVIKVEADEGRMFVPRVRAISGQVSVQTLQAGAPQIVSAATAQARREAPMAVANYQRLGTATR